MGEGGLESSADGLIRTAGRAPRVVAFEAEVLSFFVDAADILGVPKSVAAIYGICFASAEPLSFADIDARLDISQGSISQGLRVLRDVGALKIASELPHPALNSQVRDAKRRDYYTPDLELRKLAAHFIEQRLEKQLGTGKQRLEAMQAAVPAGENGSAEELKARLTYLQSWHDQARALVPLARTFLKL